MKDKMIITKLITLFILFYCLVGLGNNFNFLVSLWQIDNTEYALGFLSQLDFSQLYFLRVISSFVHQGYSVGSAIRALLNSLTWDNWFFIIFTFLWAALKSEHASFKQCYYYLALLGSGYCLFFIGTATLLAYSSMGTNNVMVLQRLRWCATYGVTMILIMVLMVLVFVYQLSGQLIKHLRKSMV